jgi:hypothetical protein
MPYLMKNSPFILMFPGGKNKAEMSIYILPTGDIPYIT